jgi:ketosteroid isomerase-like protein
MEINLPDTKAEVEAAFERYEAALMANDVETLQSLFWNSPHTIRYGINEILHGWEAIGAFRAGRSTVGLARTISHTVITTFGRDFATASTLFHRVTQPGKIGRQQQSWARFPDGWHIVAAHVSVIDET